MAVVVAGGPFGVGAREAWAQVLARPGWAGSGVSPEAWWPRAVFYRLDPGRFQDASGDGRGDLPGVVERLDYLQSLGVDALVLDRASDVAGDALGDLVGEASRHRLRVLITLRGGAGEPRDQLLRRLHEALAAGAAGAWVPHDPAQSFGENAALLRGARGEVGSFPGERVLLTDPSPVADTAAAPVAEVEAGRTESSGRRRRSRHAGRSRQRRSTPRSEVPVRAGRGNQLVLTAALPVQAAGSGALRASLRDIADASGRQAGPGGTQPLLAFAQPPATGSADAAADALALLSSRGAILLDFGEELGLDLYAPLPATSPAAGKLPVMQWTPGNETAAPLMQAVGAPAKPAPPQFGAYHPYVHPPRGLGVAASKMRVEPDRNIPAALPDPDTLPGFTSGDLPNAPLEGARRNVVTEDRDPQSLLNLYRQLIALHHGEPALRNGSQMLLPGTPEGTLAWLREAPAGARTAGTLLAAVNLSGSSVTLALSDALASAGLRSGALRPLVSYPALPTGQSTAGLVLPPHTAFLGEITRGGVRDAEPRSERRRGRRRHRIRR